MGMDMNCSHTHVCWRNLNNEWQDNQSKMWSAYTESIAAIVWKACAPVEVTSCLVDCCADCADWDCCNYHHCCDGHVGCSGDNLSRAWEGVLRGDTVASDLVEIQSDRGTDGCRRSTELQAWLTLLDTSKVTWMYPLSNNRRPSHTQSWSWMNHYWSLFNWNEWRYPETCEGCCAQPVHIVWMNCWMKWMVLLGDTVVR